MQARYYDPLIGRFLSTDPIGYQDQLNLYAYVGNDPVNRFDPFGLAEVEIKRWYTAPTGSRIGSGMKTITVEAGNLTQGQAESALSGLSNSFFATNDGQNISSYAKPVTGGSEGNRDRVGVQTQVAGRIVAQSGNSDLQSAWAGISSFNIQGSYNYSSCGAGICAVSASNPPGSGSVNIWASYWGQSGVDQITTLIHEALHDTGYWSQRYNPLQTNCGRGFQIDCLGEEEVHGELDAAARNIVQGN